MGIFEAPGDEEVILPLIGRNLLNISEKDA